MSTIKFARDLLFGRPATVGLSLWLTATHVFRFFRRAKWKDMTLNISLDS